MAINLRLGTLKLDQIAFGFSPAPETLLSPVLKAELKVGGKPLGIQACFQISAIRGRTHIDSLRSCRHFCEFLAAYSEMSQQVASKSHGIVGDNSVCS